MINENTNTINYAIDLGTSDSLIAFTKDNHTHIIKNHSTNEIYTPSVIAMDEENIIIGQEAKKRLLLDPENAISEFKLNMGFPIKFKFEKTEKEMKPEELAAELIKDLRKSAYDENKDKVEHTVITVPANSNPLKTKATLKAAKIAGIRSCYLLSEPIAAAIAYGLQEKYYSGSKWLIYDLGGGTFDASIVKANDEELEKLATRGMDNLGGKIFDWKIVDLFRKQIINETKVKNFTKNNRKYSKVFVKLKYEAEKAKILLNNQDTAHIKIDELLTGYDFEYTLTIENLKNIMNPFIKKTINICRDLLEETKTSNDEIEKIILVGGSTLSRIIRDTLKEQLGMPLEYNINPLTVVVEGASLYASTLSKPVCIPKDDKYYLILNYENRSKNDSFMLKGRIITTDANHTYLGYKIKIEGTQEVPVEIDGSFKTIVKAPEDENKYAIEVYDDNDKKVQLDEHSPNIITYTKSIKPGSMQLPKSIKIGLKNQDTKTIASKQTELRYTNKTTVYTTKTLQKEVPDEIVIPILSGENRKIKNNIQVGQIRITSDIVNDDLPINSAIDIHTQIDNLDDIRISIYIPHTKQTLNNIFHYTPAIYSLEELEKDYNHTIDTLKNYKESIMEYPEIEDLLTKLEDEKTTEYLDILLSLAREDLSIVYTTVEYLDNVNSYIEKIEEIIEKEALKTNIEYKIAILNQLLDNATDKNQLEKLNRKYISTDDLSKFYKIHEGLIELYAREYTKETVNALFFDLRYEGIFTENKEESERLIQDGLNNIASDDYNKLHSTIQKLYNIDERIKYECSSDVELIR